VNSSGKEVVPPLISTNDFRSGLTIEHEGDPYVVLESMHVKPGKGQAFVRSKLKNLITGTIINKTWRAAEKVPRAHIETREMQFLYEDNGQYYFMDTETYEQQPINEEQLEGAEEFLKENDIASVQFYENKCIGVELPAAVVLEVVHTTPGLRGDTASGGSKPAEVETGTVVQVPLFVETGDRIKINTETGEYITRE
jgi:elongation factor P